MTDDSELLRRYAEESSEDAFAELVHRHIDFVYATAVRLGRNPHRADDITQAVFTDLARKARSLAGRHNLVGWLYIATHYAATAVVRGEVRRAQREGEAARMNATDSLPENPIHWVDLAPFVDAALRELSESDRNAILQRFFRNRSFAEVAAELGLGQEAAKKRVQRALEKLRLMLERRGVTSTSAALSAALASSPLVAAPAGLAQSVIVTSTTLPVVAAGVFEIMSYAKVITGTLVALALGGGIYWSLGAVRLKTIVGTEGGPSGTSAGAEQRMSSGSADTVRPALPQKSAKTETVPEGGPSLAEILAESDSLRAFALYSRHLLALKPDEFPGVFARLQSIGRPEQRENFITLLLQRWGQVDPLGGIAALTAFQTKPAGDSRWLTFREVVEYKNHVLKGWVVLDSQAAWNWAMRYSEADLEWAAARQIEEGGGVVALMAGRGTGSPVERARDQFHSIRLRELLDALTDARRFDDSARFLAASPSELTDQYGSTVATRLMLGWVPVDLSAARLWLEKNSPPGRIRLAALSGLVQAMAAEEPELATQYVRSLSERAEIDAAGAGVMNNFRGRGDTAGAYRWIESTIEANSAGIFDNTLLGFIALGRPVGAPVLDPGLARTVIGRIQSEQVKASAIRAYTVDAGERSPEEGFGMMMHFYPPEQLWSPQGPDRGILSRIVARWAQRDRPRAVAFIQTLGGVPEEVRASLLTAAGTPETK